MADVSGYCDTCEKPIKVGSQFYMNRSTGTLTCRRCKKREQAPRKK